MPATAMKDRNEIKPSDSPSSEPMRGARILLEALVREGVDTIFGYPGGAVLHIYDELAKFGPRLRHVLARHEQGAIHMAEGYSKATGKTGVGAGDLWTRRYQHHYRHRQCLHGFHPACHHHRPVVPRKMIGTDAFQEVDTIGITRPCTKYNYMVQDVHEVAEIVHEAFYLARTGRPGPVLIDVPKDVTAEKIALQPPVPIRLPGYQPSLLADQQQVERALEKVLAAKRPVLYVGGGIIHSGGSEELFRLAEALHIPVTPTLMGLGCFPGGTSAEPGNAGNARHLLGQHGDHRSGPSAGYRCAL